MHKQSHRAIDKSAENRYWQNQFRNEGYYQQGREFEDYEPAYRVGIEGYARYRDTHPHFDQAEEALRSDYEHGERAGHATRIGWEHAKHAARAAWRRLGGDAPRDAGGH